MLKYKQVDKYTSPFSKKKRLGQMIWEVTWYLFCEWTPKPLNRWRLLILKSFGAKINGLPFVHQRARIDHPWNLTLQHRSCLGDRSHAYCLDKIEIDSGACVAQEVYLCTASHDLNEPHWPLITAPIYIGEETFIGARAFVMPGVSISNNCIVGACTTVTKSLPAFSKVVGDKARLIN